MKLGKYVHDTSVSLDHACGVDNDEFSEFQECMFHFINGEKCVSRIVESLEKRILASPEKTARFLALYIVILVKERIVTMEKTKVMEEMLSYLAKRAEDS